MSYKNLQGEKTRLETLLKEFGNSNGYKRIRQIAEEEVTNSLSKRKDLLQLATTSVIESVTRDPDKYNFLVRSRLQWWTIRFVTTLYRYIQDSHIG
jgi:hypothetical protein